MANLEAYPLHGGQLRQIAERFGIPVTELLDFSANINPSGPPHAVLSTLRASLDDPATLIEYPDLQQTDLKRSLARYAGTSEKNVVVANGFVPLLESALRALKIRSCLLPVPAFVEYRKTLERMRVGVIPYTLRTEASFLYGPVTMFGQQTDAVLLANPQNPSGICHDAAAMSTLVSRALERNMYVLLDEAFIDYVPEHSLSARIDHHPNLLIFRSVTKFYGIPGLRVAYALTSPALSVSIGDDLPPWPITTMASRAVSAALLDQTYAHRSRCENLTRMLTMKAGLKALGLKVFPSSANFILFRLPPNVAANAFWRNMIVQHRVVLRSCANYEGLSNDHFRIAIRAPEQNNKLLIAIAESLLQCQS